MIQKLVEGEQNQIDIQSTKIQKVNLVIKGNNNIVLIEEDVIVKEKLDLSIEGNFCKIMIRKNTSFEDTAINLSEDRIEVIIGEDCMFAANTMLLASDFHSIIDLETGSRTNFSRKIELGEHVWLGSRAIILKNVTIGSGSIIGAGSVVHHSFGSHVVVSGSPATVVKENVYWTRDLVPKKSFPLVELNTLEDDIKFHIEKELTSTNYRLEGWAFIEGKDHSQLEYGIIVEDNLGRRKAYPTYRYLSKDVATYYQNENYAKIRFKAIIGVNRKNIYRIFLVMRNEQEQYYKKIFEDETNHPKKANKKGWFH